MDFGERIESIKGTMDSCTITFSNGKVLKCYGELTIHGFCIYKSGLGLAPEEVIKLQEMIKEKAKEFKNPTRIYIE